VNKQELHSVTRLMLIVLEENTENKLSSAKDLNKQELDSVTRLM